MTRETYHKLRRSNRDRTSTCFMPQTHEDRRQIIIQDKSPLRQVGLSTRLQIQHVCSPEFYVTERRRTDRYTQSSLQFATCPLISSGLPEQWHFHIGGTHPHSFGHNRCDESKISLGLKAERRRHLYSTSSGRRKIALGPKTVCFPFIL